MSPISNWCSNWYWKSSSVYMKIFSSQNANVSENSWPGIHSRKWTQRKREENKKRLGFIWKLESKLHGKSNWVIIMCAKLNYAFFPVPAKLHELFCEFDRVWNNLTVRNNYVLYNWSIQKCHNAYLYLRSTCFHSQFHCANCRWSWNYVPHCCRWISSRNGRPHREGLGTRLV